MGSLANILC